MFKANAVKGMQLGTCMEQTQGHLKTRVLGYVV